MSLLFRREGTNLSLPLAPLIVLTSGYTLALFAVTLWHYLAWRSTAWDLGFYAQALWLISQGHLQAYSTLAQRPLLADSGQYTTYLLAPLYRLGGVPLLLLLQATALGSGLLFLRLLLNRLRIAPPLAWGLCLTYAAYPAVLGANLFDFHPDVFAVPALFGVIWALETERWTWYYIALALALFTKDMVATAAWALAVPVAMRRRYLSAALTAAFSLAVLWFTLRVVMPGMTHQAVMNQWAAYYSRWGPTPMAGLSNLFLHPWYLFAWMADLRAWLYLGTLVLPLLVLPLLIGGSRSGYLWPALSLIEVNLLSSFPAQTAPFDQYSLFAIPFLFVSTAYGLARPLPFAKDLPSLQRLVATVSLLVVFGWEAHTHYFDIPQDQMALAAAASRIPSRGTVVSQNFILPHLADRPVLYDLNEIRSRLPSGAWILLDRSFSTGNNPPAEVRRYLHGLADSPKEQLIFHQDGIYLFHSSPQGR
ncbi:MAG: DUF2079 domain-containing protein [Thermaerobacter sp.]|nr:DUF2079 domain-containing protein [Thermaerobacter sp.]